MSFWTRICLHIVAFFLNSFISLQAIGFEETYSSAPVNAGIKTQITRPALHDSRLLRIPDLTFDDTEATVYKAQVISRGLSYPVMWATFKGQIIPALHEQNLSCAISTHASRDLKTDSMPTYCKAVLEPNNRFSVSIPIQAEQNSFKLTLTGKNAAMVATETFQLTCAECFYSNKSSPTGTQKQTQNSSWTISPSLGLTQVNYTETNIPSYSGLLLTPKLGVVYALSEHWNLGVSTFFTAAQFNSNRPSIEMSFLSFNGSIGYQLPGTSSWKTSFYSGAYSLGMNVTSNAFGFNRQSGPYFMLAEKKSFTQATAMTAYLKYSILLTVPGSSSSNREVAAGLGYEFDSYHIHFDASEFAFKVSTISVKFRTLTLNFGIRL